MASVGENGAARQTSLDLADRPASAVPPNALFEITNDERAVVRELLTALGEYMQEIDSLAGLHHHHGDSGRLAAIRSTLSSNNLDKGAMVYRCDELRAMMIAARARLLNIKTTALLLVRHVHSSVVPMAGCVDLLGLVHRAFVNIKEILRVLGKLA